MPVDHRYLPLVPPSKVAASNASLFEMWGGSLKPLQLDGDKVTFNGTTVHVSEDADAC